MIQPKNDKNTAFTLFPIELLDAIKDSFLEEFQDYSKQGRFLVYGRIYQGEIVLRVGYLKNDSITQVNFDTSIESSGSEASVVSALENLVFSTKELFVDYFKNLNLEHFSYHWNPLNSSSKVFYKFDATNTELEAQANALIGEDFSTSLTAEEEGLIKGDMSDSDEIEKIVESLQTSSFTFK